MFSLNKDYNLGLDGSNDLSFRLIGDYVYGYV